MIKVIKLSSGELIIGEIEEHGENETKVKNVRFIQIGTGEDGKPAISLPDIFGMFSDDKVITISNSQITLSINPISELEEGYNALITGILTPSKKLIV